MSTAYLLGSRLNFVGLFSLQAYFLYLLCHKRTIDCDKRERERECVCVRECVWERDRETDRKALFRKIGLFYYFCFFLLLSQFRLRLDDKWKNRQDICFLVNTLQKWSWIVNYIFTLTVKLQAMRINISSQGI